MSGHDKNDFLPYIELCFLITRVIYLPKKITSFTTAIFLHPIQNGACTEKTGISYCNSILSICLAYSPKTTIIKTRRYLHLFKPIFLLFPPSSPNLFSQHSLHCLPFIFNVPTSFSSIQSILFEMCLQTTFLLVFTPQKR